MQTKRPSRMTPRMIDYLLPVSKTTRGRLSENKKYEGRKKKKDEYGIGKIARAVELHKIEVNWDRWESGEE